ncbi:hypothetical protein EC973_001687 [Apophysomyces ossiformis]|uniref:PH domain-containing protein n=1 Tax=Apophysomyces ossiformis TaxID=679940 RepID=A0A8H7BTE8_9FUNG|nr:hypothetical protein EC973_001687 [Apophysomyces ossiformis]
MFQFAIHQDRITLPPRALWKETFARWKANRFLKRVVPADGQSAGKKMSLKQHALHYFDHIITKPPPAIIAPPSLTSSSSSSPHTKSKPSSHVSDPCLSLSQRSLEPVTGYQKEQLQSPPDDRNELAAWEREEENEKTNGMEPADQQVSCSSSSSSSSSSSVCEDESPSLKRTSSKSQTLSKVPTLERIHRALPPLPDSPSVYSSRYIGTTGMPVRSDSLQNPKVGSKLQLRRAATWLGRPLQKLLSSPQLHQVGRLVSSSSAKHISHDKTFDDVAKWFASENSLSCHEAFTTSEEDEIAKTGDKEIMTKNSLQPADVKRPSVSATRYHPFLRSVNEKTFLHCKVVQITNHASSRSYRYELSLQVNGHTKCSHHSAMKKTAKNVSMDKPDMSMPLEFSEPFDLSFAVAVRPARRSLGTSLANLWRGRRKSKASIQPEIMEMVGMTSSITIEHVDSLEEEKSSHCYKIRNACGKETKDFDMELTVEFEIQRKAVPVSVTYPWANLVHSLALSKATKDEEWNEDEEEKESQLDPALVAQAIERCKQGDYLTIYVRSMGFPIWKRYWVTLWDGYLELRDFTFESKGPASIIPLHPLLSVSRPTEEDRENMCIKGKQGLVVLFDRSKAMVVQPVRLEENEDLVGKMYMFADSYTHSLHWRRALQSYVDKNSDTQLYNENGVDVRFLW